MTPVIHFEIQALPNSDCNSNNIMMEASAMFPQGFHPLLQNQEREFTDEAKHFTRTQHPPKYYFLDFGISRRYDPANGPPLELPIEGGDRTVPEFQDGDGPCDPFPTDVYYLGNLIRQEFLEVISMLFEFIPILIQKLFSVILSSMGRKVDMALSS
jgi:hypothetical protein